METEARDRLARLISHEDQERLGVQFGLRMGPAADELVRYTIEHDVDLAIVQARPGEEDIAHAHALLDKGRCAVLVLR
jgi:hypothetical protein